MTCQANNSLFRCCSLILVLPATASFIVGGRFFNTAFNPKFMRQVQGDISAYEEDLSTLEEESRKNRSRVQLLSRELTNNQSMQSSLRSQLPDLEKDLREAQPDSSRLSTLEKEAESLKRSMSEQLERLRQLPTSILQLLNMHAFVVFKQNCQPLELRCEWLNWLLMKITSYTPVSACPIAKGGRRAMFTCPAPLALSVFDCLTCNLSV